MWLYSLKKQNIISLFFNFKHVTTRMWSETEFVAPKLSNKVKKKKKTKNKETTLSTSQTKSSH